MRNDLSVLCFDSTLKLLWKKQLAHKLHDVPGLLDHYQVQDVYIRLLPLVIKENHNSGSIILGLSMKPVDLYSETRIKLESGLSPSSSSSSSSDKDKGKENPETADINIQSKLQHFNVYALNANNGDLIWRHDGIDVKPEQYIRTLPQNAFKLQVGADITNKLHMGHGHGMNDWTTFRQSLFGELPHLWRDAHDTNIRIAHFVRRHLGMYNL